MKLRKTLLGYLLLANLLGCTQSRVKKYHGLLEPLVGKAKKSEVNKILGNPIYCRPETRFEMCEYRTAYSQNNPVPDIFRKSEGLGPDLSPYEYFDVLHLYFDSFQVLKEWEPIVMAQ